MCVNWKCKKTAYYFFYANYWKEFINWYFCNNREKKSYIQTFINIMPM